MYGQLTQATAGPNEPHAANFSIAEDQSLALEDTFGKDLEGPDFLLSKLPTHPKLHHGRLPNGLQYVILPNKVPPNRYHSTSSFSSSGLAG